MVQSIDKLKDGGAAYPMGAPPDTALLSNGRYSVLLTEAGSGYASWRGLDVTRWREDGTRDCWGQFCYVRDLDDEMVWTIGRQPICRADAVYEHGFRGDRAEFRCSAGDIDIRWEVCVATDYDAEVRLLRLFNRGTMAKELELTSYSEICLHDRRADSAHPAFAKLFVETWFDAGSTALFARRRPRSGSEKPIWSVHVSASSEYDHRPVEYDTDRYRFLGRGRTPINPSSLELGARLSATTGPVLDPVFSLRRRVRLKPSGMARVAFVTGAADDKEQAEAIAKRFVDIDAAGRAFSDAMKCYVRKTSSSNLSVKNVAVYNRLAGSLAFSDPGFREGGLIFKEPLNTESLWSVGISGDLPILLLRIDDTDGNTLLEDVIDAHAFITGRGLPFDLVLLDASGTSEAMRSSIEAKVRVEKILGKTGGVHFLSGGTMADSQADAIAAAARVILHCSRGSLADQAQGRSTAPRVLKETKKPFHGACDRQRGTTARTDLLFWNGRGGFADGGREYVIATDGGSATPMPWCNVIANRAFGCLTSESGLGYTWAGNSQLNRLTPWSNDPVSDSPSEVIYLRDEETGELWTPTPLPLGQSSAIAVRHGQGYSRYDGTQGRLHHQMMVHVPPSDPIKIVRIAIRNDGTEARILTATYFIEWVLGTLRENASARVACEFDSDAGAVIARNIWENAFSQKSTFVASSVPPRSFTCDRPAFLGRNGSVFQPVGLDGSALGGAVGTLNDPCTALTAEISIPPARTVELVFVLGQADSRDEVRRLVREYAEPGDARHSVEIVSRQWDEMLSAVTVRTPDTAFDLMMNRWLLYQVLSCRIWARTGFYQSGGAYGFRDQLQDVAALVHCAPDEARAHILRAAERQFTEGDVQHWWHAHSGAGVRSRCSDDLLWLPFVVSRYVTATGDATVLDETVPFLEAPPLGPDEHEAYGHPSTSQERATVYEHCTRAIDRSLTSGPHGLPLIGSGDWNDGMSRVGRQGHGESVWLAWFQSRILREFTDLAERRADKPRAARYRSELARLTVVLEQAWDGDWYRRAYFDDGTPLGSAQNEECRIDTIAQSWAVLSGTAPPARSERAMDSVRSHLIRRDSRVILLLSPPFDTSAMDPGYIRGYIPGVRENGGQYTHAALWVVMAVAKLGNGDEAVELFHLLNPINHTRTAAGVTRYKVEPYVVAADVYAHPAHAGRGGWTWYTGSAAWMYRTGLESILGIERRGSSLTLNPCIPFSWPGFSVVLRCGASRYEITVENPQNRCRGISEVLLDGIEVDPSSIPFRDDGGTHHIRAVIGEVAPVKVGSHQVSRKQRRDGG